MLQVQPPVGEAVEEEPDALIMFDEMSEDEGDGGEEKGHEDGDDKSQSASQPVFFKWACLTFCKNNINM